MVDLKRTDRVFSRGVTEAYFLPAIAAASGIPTRSEIAAGTRLTKEIADWSGWTTTSAAIATPDLGTRFDSQIPGVITAEASSITFYATRTGDDVRKVLPRDTVGFIVLMDGGDVPGSLMDVFAVSVASVGKARSLSAALTLPINFTITRVPIEDATIPAAA